MREWRPGGRGRDDGLDAVAGCLGDEPVRLARWESDEPIPLPSWRGGAVSLFWADDIFEP